MAVVRYKRLAVSLAPRAMRSYRDFTAALDDPDKARIVARWFLTLNRLKEFRLAIEIGGTSKEQAGRKRSGRRRVGDKRSPRTSN